MTRSVFIFVILLLTFSALFGQTKKDSLYVFVGEKIEVMKWPLPPVIEHIDTTIVNGDTAISKSLSVSMNERFIAKYKVLQQVYGSLKSDTIEFLAFDHYGTPRFSKYKYVMLFVSNRDGKLYHEKYQFFDVYKTQTGRWASSYKVVDYTHDYNKNTSVKPEIIDFVQPVLYTIKGRNKEDIDLMFPSPYFRIVGEEAIAVWGNYVEELFQLKKSGVLKARGIFD